MNNENWLNKGIIDCTTSDIKTTLKEKECKDIWKKECPRCGKVIFYSSMGNLKRSVKKNSVCNVCRPGGKGFVHKKTDFERLCPKCNRVLVYKVASEKNRAEKKKLLCVSCVQKGHPYHGKLESCLRGEKHPLYGRPMPQHVKQKLSQTRKIKHSPETKRLMRVRALERLNRQGVMICYNEVACEYFDKLSLETGWKLQHAKNGGEVKILGYSLDSYDKIGNIVVEYDEPYHYDCLGALRKKDIIRMNEIIEFTGCTFYRYNEKTKKLCCYTTEAISKDVSIGNIF